MIKTLHSDVILTLVDLNARLLTASRAEENGRFVQTLTDIERCVRYTREQLQTRIVIDLDDVEDDEL